MRPRWGVVTAVVLSSNSSLASDGAASASAIAPGLDPVMDSDPSLSVGAERRAVDELVLQCGDERFDTGVDTPTDCQVGLGGFGGLGFALLFRGGGGGPLVRGTTSGFSWCPSWRSLRWCVGLLVSASVEMVPAHGLA